MSLEFIWSSHGLRPPLSFGWLRLGKKSGNFTIQNTCRRVVVKGSDGILRHKSKERESDAKQISQIFLLLTVSATLATTTLSVLIALTQEGSSLIRHLQNSERLQTCVHRARS